MPKSKRYNLRLTPEDSAKLQALASKLHRSVNGTMEEAIRFMYEREFSKRKGE